MSTQARVVVTGIGLVSPLGNSAPELFEHLVAGRSAVQRWPELDEAGFRTSVACRAADFKCDPLRRGRSMVLAAAVDAVQAAGSPPLDGAAVFIGSTLGESLAFERHAEGESICLEDHGVASFAKAVAARCATKGAAHSIATACAAGNYALGAALREIRHGRATVALAGGVEPFSRLAMVGFSRSRAMAADRCRPFDRDRTGMLLGEGAAIFVLELAEAAVARGVNPLCEVVALGLSSDAHHPTAPQPDGRGMTAAMHSALAQAGITADEVDWVNVHGSGTRVSDAAEARALRAVFRTRMPLLSGSKGALGHALGAASALEAAICVQGSLRQMVPSTAGHERPDPDGGLGCTTQPVSTDIRWIMNNAFAFGGLNSSLLLRRWQS